MTVQTNTTVATGIGNGVTSVFPIPFKFNRAEDLIVYLVIQETEEEIPLTLHSDYTVTGAGNENGGNLTMLAGPLPVGQSVVAQRIVDLRQLTDLRNQGRFFAEVHEDVFDKLVMIDQQQQTHLDRAMVVDLLWRWNALNRRIINVGDPIADKDAAHKRYVDQGDNDSRSYADSRDAHWVARTLRTADPLSPLPGPETRAGKLLSFDSTGRPVVVAPEPQSATELAMRLADPKEGGRIVAYAYPGDGALERSIADKLDDTISVLDFGRLADGEHSDAFHRAFHEAGVSGKILRLPGGRYRLNKKVTAEAGIFIFCDGDVVIECIHEDEVHPMDALFRFNGEVQWMGGAARLIGNNSAYLGIHSPVYLPVIENVTFEDLLSVAGLFGRNFSGSSINGYSGSNGVGHGYMQNCHAKNCGAFALPTGQGAGSDTSFGLIDCTTDANTGSVTNIWNLAGLGRGFVRGGLYRGVPTSAPNMTRTKVCEYLGGRYENMLRGPTVGEDVEIISIIGGSSAGMAFSGVSVDARKADRSVPYVAGKVDWAVEGDPTYGAFVQASGVEVNISHHGGGSGTSSNRTVRLTDSKDVKLGNIHSHGAGASVLIDLGSADAPDIGSTAQKTGSWVSDTSQQGSAVRMSAESFLSYGPLRSVNQNSDLSVLDETVLVYASSGVVDLDVPSLTVAGQLKSKAWRLIIMESAFNVTITREGGGADAINGGSSFTVPAGSDGKVVIITAIGGGKYAVTANID